MQAKAYAEKVNGELKRDGFKKWSVIEYSSSSESYPEDLKVEGEKAKTFSIKVTKFYNVEKGAQILIDAKVSGKKVINSYYGFFNTLARDLREIDRRLDGDSWTDEKRDKFEKGVYIAGRFLTGIVFSAIRVASMGYTLAQPTIRKKNNDEK